MKRGDIVCLGRHRLMCGDAGDPAQVADLLDGAVPDLVFTSPPYDAQRNYGGGMESWLWLMRRVFGAFPARTKTQVLVNLGIVHKNGEWDPYWTSWVDWMRSVGWRRFGWYVWDQGHGLPGDFGGRFNPSHEFIFHFNRNAVKINKTVRTKSEGHIKTGSASLRNPDGSSKIYNPKGTVTGSHRVGDSIVRVSRMRHTQQSITFGHPAVFPVRLAEEMQRAFAYPGQAVYEPFSGSGTSLMAAQKTGLKSFSMELEPKYCHMAMRRFESGA